MNLDAFPETITDPTAVRGLVDAYWGDGRATSLARFFKQHTSHDICVCDEYGKMYDSCGERFVFECGHNHYCDLDKGHTGPHKPPRRER